MISLIVFRGPITSHSFFSEITDVACLLKDWKDSEDLELSAMAKRTLEKYEKYWGNIERINPMIYVAVILDPRRKLEVVEFVLKELYGKEKGETMGIKVREELILLLNVYKQVLFSV